MTSPLLRTALVSGSAVAYLGVSRAANLVRGASQARALALLQSWSRRTCRTLGIEVHVSGEVPVACGAYIANHRSYLDIPVLASVLRATFLSNHNVAGLAIVGAAARDAGVVFVDRDDLQGRVRAARQIARSLRRSSIIVFPEGTTNEAEFPRRFHGGLFRLLKRLGTAAVPITLRYSSRHAYWIEDVGIGEHLRRDVLAGGSLRVDVHVGTPLHASAGMDSDGFAASVYDAVCAPIAAHGELAPPPASR
jgi:1-acyl-sn-glycerol-3-phosphate acyltransferase